MSWSSYANRGMMLEQIVELANRQYEAKGQAIIQKIHTPVKVLKTQRDGRITGFWEKKSTVDFVGVYGTRAIAFDTKQTKGKNLPLVNIEKHQIDFMLKWRKQGHQAFLLVYFSDLDRYFRLDILDIIEFMETNTRKSIPIAFFEEKGTEIGKGKGIVLDYLRGVA